MNLPPPTADEETPFKDLTGQVVKTEDEPFAGGGFSDVFRGQLTYSFDLKIRVAIKVLRGRTPGSLEITRRRFNRESRLWHALEHPNILPFLGISSGFSRFPALVSPLCDLGNVIEYLSTHPGVDRLDIVIGTAKGLEYLHSNGVIHGDMKGHNVLIDDLGVPCLSDFGRSLIIGKRGFTTDLSGSACYMAPELLGPTDDGSPDIDPDDFVPSLTKASDIYGFDMVALEVLTGNAPWHYCVETQAILRVKSGERPNRQKHNLIAVSDALWEFLEECWVEQPEARPQVTAVVQRLTSLQPLVA